jgi:hypothetical protein
MASAANQCIPALSSPMVNNSRAFEFFTGTPETSREEAAKVLVNMDAIHVPRIGEVDVSNVILFLASDEARYMTGTTQVVAARALSPHSRFRTRTEMAETQTKASRLSLRNSLVDVVVVSLLIT